MMEFDIAMSIAGFGALRLCPVLEVANATGNFGLIPIEDLIKARNTARAPGSKYNRGQFTFTPQTYACDEHGWEEPVDDREASMYAEYFDAELVAAMRARWSVMGNFEQRVCDQFSSTSTWTGSSLTTNISTAWTTPATATPVSDVLGAKLKVYANSGLVANAVVMSWLCFQRLRNCADIIDRVKYGGFQDPNAAALTPRAVAQAFDVEEIIIMGGVEDSANEGQAFSGTSMWNDSRVMVCRVARTQDVREPCIGRTFHNGRDGSQIGGLIETYRDETVRSDIVRCRMDTDEKTMYVQAGHLLTGATA